MPGSMDSCMRRTRLERRLPMFDLVMKGLKVALSIELDIASVSSWLGHCFPTATWLAQHCVTSITIGCERCAYEDCLPCGSLHEAVSQLAHSRLVSCK